MIDGTVAPGFEPVREAFVAAFEGRPRMGAALAVLHQGRPVVDLWGGTKDARTDEPWGPDTLTVLFSCTKGLTSILAARLVQEGRLDYDAPVCEYWPEFAAAGKAHVRVGHLLAHRSGLSAPRTPLSEQDVLDWDLVVGRLAAQEPLWEPGTGYAYHAITHGWLVGEVIRRITGRSVGEQLAEVVTRPLAVDAYIGLPDELHDRVARPYAGPALAELAERIEAMRADGPVDWSIEAMTLGGAFPPALVSESGGFNSRAIRSAQIPGAGGIGSARALATIWSATVVETDGVRLLDRSVVARATREQSAGEPVWPLPGPWSRWGLGFQIDSENRRYLTPSGFGHDGAGGQSAFADPELGVGVAFLTTEMEARDDRRATRIVDALREVLDGRGAAVRPRHALFSDAGSTHGLR
jgi:CubicO group peptidase (beta-lactamase class C family)